MVALSFGLHVSGLSTPDPGARTTSAWALILGSGLLAAASYVLIAEAGLLAPFQYVEIIGATAAGFLVFETFQIG